MLDPKAARVLYAFDITSAGVVTITHAGTPTDATFDAFLDFCDAHRARLRCYLILAGAGAPTAAQRARSKRRHPHLTLTRTAIVSFDSATLAPVAGLLQRDRPTQVIRVFPDSEMAAALAFLQLEAEEAREACRSLLAQAHRVGLSLPNHLTAALEKA
jgi:hypothetical protein